MPDETKVKSNGSKKEMEKNAPSKQYVNQHKIKYPELYRSDVSIHPTYSNLINLPYFAVCRRRVYKTRKTIAKRFNQEIKHMVMMQSNALSSVRIERIFSVGFPPDVKIPDLATSKERRRINELLNDRR